MRKNLLTALWLLSVHVVAQDTLRTTTLPEVVVTGTKFEIPVDKSGKVVFKVSSESLAQGDKTVADVLNQIPGLQIDGNYSSPGANISYYVRGGRNRHTLIAVDGIPMVDPSGIEPFFDLRFLPLDQFQSIEVLQGSLSTLYGSSASAGVINLQTKENTEQGFYGSVQATAGSWNSFGQALHLNGRFGNTSILFTGNNSSSDGFSAALDDDPLTDFDKDGFIRRNAFLKVNHTLSPGVTVSAFSSLDWFENEYDTWAFTDGNELQQYEHFRMGVKGIWKFKKGTLDALTQYAHIHRDEQTNYPAVYKGSSFYGEVIHRYKVTDWLTSISGATFQRLAYGETHVNEADTTYFTMADPYISLLMELPHGVNIHGGLRLNAHSMYGSQLVYNINPSWLIPVRGESSLKLFASAATAYITPTLYQLYTVWGGNKNLTPERDMNIEYGVAANLFKRVEVTAAQYYRTERNAIVYSAEYHYENISTNRYVTGITTSVKWSVQKQWNVAVDYAYASTNLAETFYRIPAHKGGASISYHSMKGTLVSIRYQYTGQRTDSYYPDTVTLKAFELINVLVSQTFLKEKWRVFFSVNNLLDEEFTAIYGYTTQGRNFTTGMSYTF